ncbi:putative C6 transcription factor [Aspergillus clavatus NRRL 1]|uniref:Transcription factor domain-containing protein n=1 Tax=Aspergillus clavatus (strain ATCC 1007 / CBS 513.65 / DSM 816 / NCTC 3887 / NRRL 1 / QM 1276 / 107) TaxID=344612 RepID=A1CCF9_ASPCL|nr:uncharacterized protein ACLA_061780 [Aspergillus clavatus NRRL 1]EAW12216.1 hypothetical protein ACLA_061780 [Aspergillus clavatus NRRL 1]
MECVKRNIGHLCTKDERQPRAKRTKTDHSSKNNSKGNSSPTQDGETDAEETAQILEHFVDGIPRPTTFPSMVLGPTLSSVAPDCPNRYWLNNDPQRQGEKMTLIQEIVNDMPELDVISLLYEVFVTRCQGPLGNVTHVPSFMKQAEQFRSCLSLASPDARVMALSSTVSMDALARYLLALVLGLSFHPTPSLLGWTPTPLTLRVEELRASDAHIKTWRSLALRCLQGGASLFCGSIISLQAAVMILLDGQEGSLALDAVLVTAISGARKLGLHRLGDVRLDASASRNGSLHNGSAASTDPPLHVRTEVGVRIWWALVMRDWSRGQALGYYTVHPSQFNTRMPLHINDDDLCLSTWRVSVNGDIAERPRTEFTMLSYTVHALELASIVRESIDLGIPVSQSQHPDPTTEAAKMRKHLTSKYEKYVAGLPSYFRLGSTVGLTATGPMAAIPVQRWMLHQQLWSLLLRLHRANLASPVGRASCQLLAQNIIGTQAQIQARCAVCGSLSTSEIQLFNAAVVLLIDLLFTLNSKDADCSSAQLSRLMTRDKVREAIELLRTKSITEGSSLHDLHLDQVKGTAQRSVVALEALMKLEEEESDDPRDGQLANTTGSQAPVGGSNGTAKDSLKIKVGSILRTLDGRSETTALPLEREPTTVDPFSPVDMSMPFSNVSEGFPDLDVLPILSNDLSPNFWQFLDFPPPPPEFLSKDGVFGTPGDLHGLVGLRSFPSPSGATQSMHSRGTPHFGDAYSSTAGTRMTHTSPSSLEGESLGLAGGSDSATTPSSADAYVAAKFYYALGDGTLPSL